MTIHHSAVIDLKWKSKELPYTLFQPSKSNCSQSHPVNVDTSPDLDTLIKLIPMISRLQKKKLLSFYTAMIVTMYNDLNISFVFMNILYHKWMLNGSIHQIRLLSTQLNLQVCMSQVHKLLLLFPFIFMWSNFIVTGTPPENMQPKYLHS